MSSDPVISLKEVVLNTSPPSSPAHQSSMAAPYLEIAMSVIGSVPGAISTPKGKSSNTTDGANGKRRDAMIVVPTKDDPTPSALHSRAPSNEIRPHKRPPTLDTSQCKPLPRSPAVHTSGEKEKPSSAPIKSLKPLVKDTLQPKEPKT
jgi:hypothetical protein